MMQTKEEANKYSVEETNQHLIRMLKHQGLI
jgi:hypothetical protein